MTFPLINCVIDFTIDGRKVPQPFSIDLESEESELVVTTRGYVIPAVRFGQRMTVIWGENATAASVIAAVRAALEAPGAKVDEAAHMIARTFAWTDPDGTVQSYNIVCEPYETQWDWSQPGFYHPLEVRAVVRSTDREHE